MYRFRGRIYYVLTDYSAPRKEEESSSPTFEDFDYLRISSLPTRERSLLKYSCLRIRSLIVLEFSCITLYKNFLTLTLYYKKIVKA